MTRIQPFQGWRYDLGAAGAAGLHELLTPPYDVISPEQQAAYYERHPHNVIRLDLARDEPGDEDEENRYTRAAATLASWREQGILRQEREPAIYLLHETYTLPGGQRATRRGLIFRLRLASWGDGILPHEHTFPAAKADRLALLIATETQCSPIFLLFSDPAGEVRAPLAAAAERPADAVLLDDDGVEHALWAIADAAAIEQVAAALEPLTFYVADGHHRYETALNYQRYRRGEGLPETDAPLPLTSWEAVPNHAEYPLPGPAQVQPFDYAWVYAASMEDPGVAILPTHRCIFDLPHFDAAQLVAQLHHHFDVTAAAGDDALQAALGQAHSGDHVFGLVLPGGEPGYLLRMRPDPATLELLHKTDHPAVAAVDVAVLQSLVLGPLLGISREPGELKRNVAFTPDAWQAIDETRRGILQAVFLVKPTTLEQLRAASDAGQVMPPKATYFYPKLPSGLVIHSMD